jgi:hypothetical protein
METRKLVRRPSSYMWKPTPVQLLRTLVMFWNAAGNCYECRTIGRSVEMRRNTGLADKLSMPPDAHMELEARDAGYYA